MILAWSQSEVWPQIFGACSMCGPSSFRAKSSCGPLVFGSSVVFHNTFQYTLCPHIGLALKVGGLYNRLALNIDAHISDWLQDFFRIRSYHFTLQSHASGGCNSFYYACLPSQQLKQLCGDPYQCNSINFVLIVCQ